MNGLTPIINKYLPNGFAYSGLALGVGIGNVEIGLNIPFIVGVDIWREYLTKINGLLIPVNYDIKKVSDIFIPKSFDVVMAFDVIEHLEKADGKKLLSDMEAIATKMVVVYTPIEWDTNEKNISNPSLWSYGNLHNLHKSLWTQKDFLIRGYTIDLSYPLGKDNPEGIIAVKRF